MGPEPSPEGEINPVVGAPGWDFSRTGVWLHGKGLGCSAPLLPASLPAAGPVCCKNGLAQFS